MTEIAQLAHDTITVLAPLLPSATSVATKVRDGFAGEAGKTLLNWVVAQFKGKPAEAVLDRALADPQNPRRLEDLRLDIEELAEQDPVFREQLARLLQAAHAEQPFVTTQTSTVTGHGSSVTQVSGSNNTVGRQ
jgi:hypothetical protein